MKLVAQNIETYYLYPSSLFSHKRRHIVSTVLGSCISVCLYDVEMEMGGINHYMLPLWNGDGLASPKYGNIAIDQLIKKMTKQGSMNYRMTAKIFGGANQINSTVAVGKRNILIARKLLQEQGITIVAESVGGTRGRKISFDTGNGEVLMKYTSKRGELYGGKE